MKYLILLLLLTSCNDSNSTKVSSGITKQEDGDIVCYTYYQNSISCVKK